MQKYTASLKVEAINIQNGNPIKDVFFELWKEVNQLPEEGLSDSNGQYEFTIKCIGMHLINAKKSGFITM